MATEKNPPSIAETLKQLQSSAAGLTQAEAKERLLHYGQNALQEKKISPLRRLFGYFWGPIPWMIEVAALLSLLVQHWTDLTIIVLLLCFNAAIGFWQEYKAANALEALKNQLALKARVLRDEQWEEIAANQLVPGDVIRIRLGDIVPADVQLLDGDYLSVDQSALTGESLPVSKKTGDLGYSGTIVKQGEMLAVVTATGMHTFFGKTAGLVQQAGAVSHFQKAVLRIGNYLIYIALGLVAILITVELFRGESFLILLQFALLLTVASIPVAMPAVLSVTMALGALKLSRMRAIVTRLESIEEMAGMQVLCSDKTGTLTQNRLTLGEIETAAGVDKDDVLRAAALASKAEDQDSIDLAVLAAAGNQQLLGGWQQQHFIPFDPVGKRTEAQVQAPDGSVWTVSKGAPQVILGLCRGLAPTQLQTLQTRIEALAQKGFRTLGVARKAADVADWEFLGMVPLFDPPREDSKDTIAQAQAHGISVKMVTGDNVAIAKEIAGELGLGTGILPADQIFAEHADVRQSVPELRQKIAAADGFAQVFPEHKYGIVKALQTEGYLVGMTGDGVNDAPALKQADVGIAVSGATDAARAAAALVLMAPGLNVIISAVDEARRIFERMNSYAIYRIVETIRIMVFVVLAMLAFNFYPITAIMIILLAFFNDVPIMAIATDNTWLDSRPVRWDMRRVLTVSTVLGLIGVVETFGMMLIAMDLFHMDIPHLQTLIFLKLAVAGHLTLFIARTRKPFLQQPWPSATLLWSAIVTKAAATLFVVYPMGLVPSISWAEAGAVWGYCIIWIFIEDWAKLRVYKHLEFNTPRHWRFLRILSKPLGPVA
ncbi:plasma-membrane proton-efflux P-type ATPase [Candidatus Igneacidithiobacillus taiwanensis]|uniref:plasma-membrane proton-efflux P-type ATPase n=1 Tax=Candidatus Igneacidithiobacillus taiwanensis TaxID=1945924 RepID=UPI002897F069|nr:plasma-membrane proton-efflux P-type ATPase [Candidatus Igneacidithiobacillus taiwanensis]